MSENRTLERVLTPSESPEGDDAVLVIYEFDHSANTTDPAFAFFTFCTAPGAFHGDEPLAA